MKCIDIRKLPKKGKRYRVQGRWLKPNEPVSSHRKGKKRIVLAKRGSCARVLHYGDTDYEHNYSVAAKEDYCSRSAGITNQSGELTKNNPLYSNYWSRNDLWSCSSVSGPKNPDHKIKHGYLLIARTNIPGVLHYGVVVEMGSGLFVIHHVPIKGSLIEPLDVFLKTRSVHQLKPTPLKYKCSEEIISGFKKCKGDYDLFKYNCKHFSKCMVV